MLCRHGGEPPVTRPLKLQFESSDKRWWQKPLVVVAGRHLPAELAVLHASLESGEDGGWLNTRKIGLAVVDLTSDKSGTFKTVRVPLPGVGHFVSIEAPDRLAAELRTVLGRQNDRAP